MEENSKELKEKLFNKKELGWNSINDREKEAIYTFSNGYMNFLNKAKIEREFVISAKEMAEQNGFRDVTKCEFSFIFLFSFNKILFIKKETIPCLLLYFIFIDFSSYYFAHFNNGFNVFATIINNFFINVYIIN